jgi:hypothetical protein
MRVRKLLALAGMLAAVALTGMVLHTSPASAAGDPPPMYTMLAGPGPMDLLAQSFDPNGLFLNPYSRYQHDYNALPNVDALCRTGDCTGQQLYFDTAQYGTWEHFACQVYHSPSATAFGSILGHANWFPVAYQGAVKWVGKSDQDGDDSLELIPPNAPGTDTPAGVVTTHSQALHMEFDNNETLARFTSPWWQSFMRSNHTAIAGKDSVVIGLYGLDCEHDCLAELHPLYVLAVHVKSDPNDDVWAIFVRRSGDEGYCSTGQMHYWNTRTVSLFLPGTGQASLSAGTQFYLEQTAMSPDAATPALQTQQNGALVTFDFSDGAMSDIFDGELHINWHP